GRPRALLRGPRSRVISQAAPGRSGRRRRCRGGAPRGRATRAGRRSAAARRRARRAGCEGSRVTAVDSSGVGTGAAGRAVPLAEGFPPCVWAPPSAAIAERYGLRVEQVVRFDQNTPPFAGVPQIPLAESFARLNEYPDGSYRELREAAAAYVGGGVGWE